MKLSIQVGSTSQTVNIFIADSSSTTGAGLTGLVFNASSLVAYYALPRAAAVSITLATLAAVTSAYSSGGFKEIDSANMGGWYRFDIPDAALASGRFVSIHLKGAANMAPLPLEIELTGWNNQDVVRGGLTALPNVVIGSSGSLLRAGANAGTVEFTNGLTIPGGVTIAPPSGNVDALYIAGHGNGNGIKIFGGANAAVPAVYVEALGSGNSPGVEIHGVGSGAGVSSTGGATGHGILAAGGSSSGDGLIATSVGGVPIRGNLTGSITGNLSGSVGSVTAGVTLAAAAVQAIWDALTSALTTSGSIGKKLADWVIGVTQTGDSFTRLGAPAGASVSADIAAVQADTDNIQTRLPAALVSGRMDSSVGAYPGNTAQTGDSFARLGAPVGASISADIQTLPTATENADGLLARNIAGGSDGGRDVTSALRPLRNKVDMVSSPGNVRVYEENDSTIAWTGALTTSASAEPIVTVDPS